MSFSTSFNSEKYTSQSCLPDTAGKTAATSFSILMTAAIALTVAILLPRDPGLNTIFYPVFSVAGSMAFVIFVIALYVMTTKKPSPPDMMFSPLCTMPMMPYGNGISTAPGMSTSMVPFQRH